MTTDERESIINRLTPTGLRYLQEFETKPWVVMNSLGTLCIPHGTEWLFSFNTKEDAFRDVEAANQNWSLRSNRTQLSRGEWELKLLPRYEGDASVTYRILAVTKSNQEQIENIALDFMANLPFCVRPESE
jgi:hypothetical protein